MQLSYTTVDVFTTTRYRGNPLAVVRVPSTLRDSLTEDQKQKIAREFNFSETTFLHDVQPGESFAYYDIFTPLDHLNFAGHPTIGTAIYLSQNAEKYANVKNLKTRAGDIPIEYDAEKGTALVGIPHAVREHQKRFAHPFPEKESNPSESHTVPIFSIVKGMAFILVPLSSEAVLGQVSQPVIPNAGQLAYLDSGAGWDCGIVGSFYYADLGEDPQDESRRLLRTRMLRSREDPGTGSASCALCAYLTLNEDIGKGEGPFKYHLVQGVEIGRRCDIFVDVKRSADGKEIAEMKMSGASVRVMEGVITVDDE